MNPKELLQQYWGYESFRPGQLELITASMQGRDVLAILPTGGGKSLCYQIPGIALDGITLVVSPLVALMQDQVSRLKTLGIKAVALSGGLSYEAVDRTLDNCIYGDYKFLFLSPERLQQDLVQGRIKQMKINLIAIDEAHCISQWGHDFRPSYAKLSALRDLAPEASIIALTATANSRVVMDIQEQLMLRDPLIHIGSLERSNLSYSVLATQDKYKGLEALLHKHPGSGIVYLRSRRACEQLTQWLNAAGHQTFSYHGGLDAKTRKERLEEWKQSDQAVMIATNAFGMGIDKADVRLVVHFQLPDSLESYYQEAGRAGRDELAAQAVLLYNADDIQNAKSMFLEQLPDLKFTTTVYKKLQQQLRIAYGEGAFESYPLDFAGFCADYNLAYGKTYASFQMMDRLGILRLSPVFSRQTKVQFTASNQQLLDFFESNPQAGMLGQMLLRLYGGIAEVPTRIALKPLARQLNRPEQFLIEQLEFMEKQGIISLELQAADSNITFMQPREDERTLYPFGKHIELYHKQKTKQFEALLNYITAASSCRQQLLAAYFDQHDLAPCGICDLCQSPKASAKNSMPKHRQVLDLLKKGPLTHDQLAESLNFAPVAVGEVLQLLLDEGLIALDHNQKFRII